MPSNVDDSRYVLLYKDKGTSVNKHWELSYICSSLETISQTADDIEEQQELVGVPGKCIIVLESDYDKDKLIEVERYKKPKAESNG